MQETELVHGLKNRNRHAFKELVDLYREPLMRLCMGFLHNTEDAGDVVQETFVEVFESIHRFREDSRLSTWLYRIAVNKSLNLIRKNKMNRLILRLDIFHSVRESDQPVQPENETGQPGTGLENRERKQQIRQAIDSLPVNQRIAFVFNKYQDLSYKEVAEVMEISVSSAESLIHRAKMNLQKRLLHDYKKNLL
jgi:RNA polymerase sigma-70 factor (ECF subfamily)